VLEFLFLIYHVRYYEKEKNVKFFCFVLLLTMLTDAECYSSCLVTSLYALQTIQYL